MKAIKQLSILILLLVANRAIAQEKVESSILDSKFNNGVHIVAEVSDSNITLKDSVTITYKLYVSQDIGISNYNILHQSENDNFIVEDIKTSSSKLEYEFFKNEKYRYVVLKKSLLKPKVKGEFNVDTLELDVTAEIPSNGTDEFGRLKMEKVKKTIKTEHTTIVVI